MPDIDNIIIRFGGEAREVWTNDGLSVTYSGGVSLRALTGPEGWQASVPEASRAGDVKADMAERSRASELACRINDSTAPPLTRAYFRAAANAGMNAACLTPLPEVEKALPEGALPLRLGVFGKYDALILAENLRILLDEKGLGWDEALDAVARSHVCVPEDPPLPECAEYRSRAPLGAIAALQPRTARLISAVNEKLCEELWRAFPGDWERIGSSAVIRDGEVDFRLLSAVMCGKIICSKETRAGLLRTLYTLWPAKFEDDDS